MRTDRTDYPGAAVELACTRKKAIQDERSARRRAAEINEREGRTAVVYYACTRCGHFHIGRAPAGG